MKAVRCGDALGSSRGKDFGLPLPRRARFLGRKPSEPWRGSAAYHRTRGSGAACGGGKRSKQPYTATEKSAWLPSHYSAARSGGVRQRTGANGNSMRLPKAVMHVKPVVPAEHDGARSNLRCDIALRASRPHSARA